MTGHWIPWTVGLTRKLEVMHLSRLLRRSRWEVASRLMQVWEWADGETVNGSLPGLGPADIDIAAGMAGFGAAMESVGWLLVDSIGVVFPNWDRWNTESAKKRLMKSRKQARWRRTIVDGDEAI
jgi:hypothetical protein